MFVDSGASDALGLPIDPYANIPPKGLEGSASTISDGPLISTWQNIVNTVKEIPSHLEEDIKKGYETAKGAVTTVAADVTAPIKSTLNSTYWYVILAVVVLGGVVYFAGKSGAVRISR